MSPRTFSLIFSSLLAYSWFGFFSDQTFIPHTDQFPLITQLSWKLSALLTALTLAIGIAWRKFLLGDGGDQSLVKPLPFFILFLLGIYSDFPERRDGFEFSRSGAAGLVALALLLVALQNRSAVKNVFASVLAGIQRSKLLTPIVVVGFVQLALFITFNESVDGRILWSDDHPSFLYRLQLMRDNFPNLLFYNTHWNTGYPSRELFATGGLNLLALLSPLFPFLERFDSPKNAAAYSLCVGFILIVAIPLLTILAARAFKLQSLATTLAGLLVCAPSLAFFEYGIRYGTLPFLISCALTPLVIALTVNLAFSEQQPTKLKVLLLVVAGGLCFTWHAIGVVFVPVILMILLRLKTLYSKGRLKSLIFAAAVIALLQAPSLLALSDEGYLQKLLGRTSLPGSSEQLTKTEFGGASDPKKESAQATTKPSPSFRTQHLSPDKLPGFFELRLSFRELTRMIPLSLLLLFIPAILGRKNQPENRTALNSITYTALWCLVLGAVGPFVKPQLELQRMGLPATIFMLLAVAHCLTLWRHGLLIALIVIPLHLAVAFQTYSNSGKIPLRFAPAWTEDFNTAVKSLPAGRLFFSGFILHDFGASSTQQQDGGHIAPLPLFSGREMFASHYYHSLWATTDPIPQNYLDREPEGIEEFLDLINAAGTVAFRPEWIKYFRSNANYSEIWQADKFHLFKRESQTPSYLLKGAANIVTDGNSIRLTVHSPGELIIKYRYHSKLKISRPDLYELFPVPTYSEKASHGGLAQVFFIGIRPVVAPTENTNTFPLELTLAFK